MSRMKDLFYQQEWIDEHGGDLAGYVERDPDNGQEQYNADVAELERLLHRPVQSRLLP